MAPLWMLNIVTLTYIFKVKISGNHIYYLENGESLQKMLKYDFIEVDTSHRMAPLQMLYIVTLTYIFNVKVQKIFISLNW